MITTSHAILNSALLGRKEKPTYYWPVIIGAVLPDVPMFLYFGFYLLNHSHIRVAPGYMNEYHFRQAWVDWSHSIPLALGLALISFLARFQSGIYFSLSMFLHSLEDLPVHAEYAHRHFLPFSKFRYFSPISYWAPRHYGNIVAPIEWIIVLISICVLWRRGLSPFAQVFLLSIGVFQGLFLVYYFGGVRWNSF